MGDRPSRWTRPLQNLVVAASLIFTIGTAVQAFVIIDHEAMVEMMRRAGAPTGGAGEYLFWFRAVGIAYLLGNALGLLARTGWRWLFWVVLLVNVTQAAGLVVIPPEVGAATLDRFGPPGLLPTLVTDGGAALLAGVLLAALVRYRRVWALRPAGDTTNNGGTGQPAAR